MHIGLSLGLGSGGNPATGISFSGSIEEGATTGRAVGTATLANPPLDIGTLTWSELGTGTGAALFAIDGSTGAVTNTAAIDYETATSYTYGIQVTDGVYTYERLATISVTNIAVVPDAPTLTATAGNGQVTLSWTDAALPAEAPAITAHKLYMGTVSGSLTLIGTITSASPYVDTGLTNGTAYYFKLSAVNAEGESALSTEQSATPSTGTAQPDGFDIIVTLGDSLIPGRGTVSRDPILDAAVAQGYQLVNHSSKTGYGTIVNSVSPPWNPDDGIDYVPAIENFARQYCANNIPSNRKVLIVPCGTGGTKLLNEWNPATPGSLLTAAVTTSNSALTQALALYPGSRVRGIIISLGSNDVNAGGYNDTNFRAAYLSIIDYLRTNITEASEAWAICGGIIIPSGTDSNACRTSIEYAANNKTAAYYVMPPFPSAQTLHPTQSENYTWGASMAAAVLAAAEPQKVGTFSITGQSGVALDTDIDSAAFLVRGVGAGHSGTITVSGGSLSVDGGAFSTSPQTVTWGSSIVCRVHSSASNSTQATATVTVTGPLGAGDAKSATFTVTTLAASTTNYTLTRASFGYGRVVSNDTVLPVTGRMLQESA